MDQSGVHLLSTISGHIGLELDGLIGNDWLLSRCLPAKRTRKKSWAGGRLNVNRFLEVLHSGIPKPTFEIFTRERWASYPRELVLNIHAGTLEYRPVKDSSEETMVAEMGKGVPIVELDVMNKNVRFAVDTGAMQSFISEVLAESLPRVGIVEDFILASGPFKADVVEIDASIGDKNLRIQAAVSNSALEPLFSSCGIEGIVGLDVLQSVPFTFSPVSDSISPVVRYA